MKLLPIVAVGVLVSVGVVGCGKSEEKAPVETVKVTPAIELAPADVATVKIGSLANELPITGSIESFNKTTVQARVGADVTAVLVREGQAVAQGQLLARLGTEDLEARVKQAEAQLSASRVEAKLSQALTERNRQLFEQNYVSAVDYQRIVGETQAREDTVKVQEAQLSIAKKALADAAVTSPMKGVVAKRYVEPGNSVSIDGRLFDIVDLNDLEIIAAVPAAELSKVSTGMPVEFQVDGFNNERFSGTVARINPVAEVGTRAFNVYIRISNQDQKLKSGMYARGSIKGGSGAEGIIIAASALRVDEKDQSYVLVLKNERIEKQVVSVMARDARAEQAMVSGQLSAGDVVVLANLNDEAINQPARLVAAAQ